MREDAIQQMLVRHKKVIFCSDFALYFMIVLIFFMCGIHTYFINRQVVGFHGTEDCDLSSYWSQTSSQMIDSIYHVVRSIILVIINFLLIKSTWQTHKLIRQHSNRNLFKKELCNIWLVYWSFVICYLGWLVLYLMQFLIY